MVKIKCPRCSHIQDTESVLIRVTCSSCNYKVNREDNIIKENKNPESDPPTKEDPEAGDCSRSQDPKMADTKKETQQ